MEVSDAMRDWLRCYLAGSQNGKRFETNSVWTRGKGDSHRGLKTCRNRGLITSHADDHHNAGGYRHDLTAAGRAVVDEMQVGVDRRRAEWDRAQYAGEPALCADLLPKREDGNG